MAYSLELHEEGTGKIVDVWVDSEKKWDDIVQRSLTYQQAKAIYPDLELQDRDTYNAFIEETSDNLAAKLRTILGHMENLEREREIYLREMKGTALALQTLDKHFLIRIDGRYSVDCFLEKMNSRLNTPPVPKSL
ncbi:hypothetical protein ASG46_10195 [Bacillus sp. Leaf49]|uniref:hypothetical protein n=1 Tax=Bacillus sp. Leaf49 TaxID=1736222 RepID=UPI0006F4D5C7|nr:hypothetical protein [Bacillus sp. Leaf49]KQU11565.1 hypothetical protein ASG46_10195 [Bacillus sp. Leaf49]